MSPNESQPPHFPEASTAEPSPGTPASSQPSKSPSTLARAGTWVSQLESIFVRRLLVVGVLGMLVMFGLFLSNYSSEKARFYWCAMFPVFGIACLAHELAAGRVRLTLTNLPWSPRALRWNRLACGHGYLVDH